MSSKKNNFFFPSKEMYSAQSECFENDIKAYIVPMSGKKCFVELNYKGNIKKGKEIFESQEEACETIWKLYLHIFNNQIKVS